MIKKHLLALSLIALSSNAYSASLCGLSDDYLNTMDQKIQTHWSNMGAVWPGVDYSKNLLVLRLNPQDPNCAVALKVGQKPKKLEGGDLEALKKIGIRGPFYPININGQKGIALFKPAPQFPHFDKPGIAFEIATHEQSHMYNQKKILDAMSDNNSRSTVFPAQAEPRIIRYQLITRIIDYLEAVAKGGDGKQALGQAAYWHKKYQSEFAGEAKKALFTDLAEGMATYINLLVNYKDVNAGLKADLVARLREDLTMRSETFSGEGYTLGAAAGAALDYQGINWKSALMDKQVTPAQLLLKDVQPIADKASEKWSKHFNQTINQQNKTTEAALTPYLKALKTSEPKFLRINSKYGGSTEVGEFVNYQGLELVTDFSVDLKAEGWKLAIKNTVIEETTEGSATYYQVPITGSFMTMEENGETFALFDLPELQGKVKISSDSKDKKGLRVILVK